MWIAPIRIMSIQPSSQLPFIFMYKLSLVADTVRPTGQNTDHILFRKEKYLSPIFNKLNYIIILVVKVIWFLICTLFKFPNIRVLYYMVYLSKVRT